MKNDLFASIADFYRDSRDFNGFYFKGETEKEREAVASLVQEGLVQVVVSEVDYPNPHIRPWPSRRGVEEQIASIRELDGEKYGVCLYPTPLALKKPGMKRAHRGQPFRRAMAKGRGALELAYFNFDVLEQYRNDPRFTFHFTDFGVTTGIGDDAYTDATEPEYDKVSMSHIGYAYDLSQYKADDPLTPIIRRVCAFYCDLAKLSPVHQQRWGTYQITDETGLRPHPVWWGQQMGHWADGLGPFAKFFFELGTWNDFFERAHGVALIKTTDRPREFGWILRPSQSEWEGFIHLLDKLLAENLRNDGLDAAGAPKLNDAGQNLGTLNRLEALMLARKAKPEGLKEVLAPLREVRSARHRPAHALRENITDRTFVRRQVELLERINQSLEMLRYFWQSHPANKDWKEPEYVADDAPLYRF